MLPYLILTLDITIIIVLIIAQIGKEITGANTECYGQLQFRGLLLHNYSWTE